jgi:hypothetical protein
MLSEETEETKELAHVKDGDVIGLIVDFGDRNLKFLRNNEFQAQCAFPEDVMELFLCTGNCPGDRVELRSYSRKRQVKTSLAALFDIEEDDDNQAKDEEGEEQDVKNPAEALEHVPVAAAPPAQNMNNEPSSLRLLDIIAADVFLSYSWGKQDPVTKEFSTQKIVMRMRPQIEQDAGVLTWVDVAMLDRCGGIGQKLRLAEEQVRLAKEQAESDAAARAEAHSSRKELEEELARTKKAADEAKNAIDKKKKMEAIRNCTVVVIFISDAYCKSANCKREFLHATKHGKHLITVLVPDNGPAYDDVSSGWTGPGPDDKVCKCTRKYVHKKKNCVCLCV